MSVASPQRPSAPQWSGHDRAVALYELRSRMIAQLPGRLSSAQALDRHRREEVFDDAAEWAAYRSPHPVQSPGELEALMWDAVHKRVLRALEGRYDTVRPDRRAGETELAALQANLDTDPVVLAEGREEMRLVLEFVRQLTPGLDRDVFWVRYTGNPRGSGVVGYAKIAARLNQPESDVRAALRRVQIQLTAYQRFVTDTDAFMQKALLALPAPVLVDRGARPSGWRETLLDWLGRPFGHDTAAAFTTAIGGGNGRGLGTLAVAICLGGTAAGGGYCIATGNSPFTPEASQAEAAKGARGARTTDLAAPSRTLRAAQRNLSALAAEEAAQRRAAARRAAGRRSRVRRARATAAARVAERREIAQDTQAAQEAPASPVAPSSSGDDFTFEQNGPEQPAAPAPAPETGGSEFLP